MANCIKCGKELSHTRVFCQDCLDGMEAYPVPAGTPVNLQQRQETPLKKTPAKKKAVPVEEQLSRLRKLLAWLVSLAVVLVLLLGVAVSILVQEWKEPNPDIEETKGQNYSTQKATTPALR